MQTPKKTNSSASAARTDGKQIAPKPADSKPKKTFDDDDDDDFGEPLDEPDYDHLDRFDEDDDY